MINNSWCDRKNAHPIQSLCSPDLEYLMLLCQPFWLQREFTEIIITAVYIPPQADTNAALKELYGHLCKQETVHTDAAFIRISTKPILGGSHQNSSSTYHATHVENYY